MKQVSLTVLLTFIMCTTGPSYGYDYTDDYIRRHKAETRMIVQTDMMQSQVNTMHLYGQQTQMQVQPSRDAVNDRFERPTYVIDKPLYKFGE